jgi:hypothetical protein
MLIVSISKIVKQHVCLVKTRGQPVAGKETLKKNSKLSEVFDIFHYLALKDSSEVFQIVLSSYLGIYMYINNIKKLHGLLGKNISVFTI